MTGGGYKQAEAALLFFLSITTKHVAILSSEQRLYPQFHNVRINIDTQSGCWEQLECVTALQHHIFNVKSEKTEEGGLLVVSG